MASDDSRASRQVTVITQGEKKTVDCLQPWLDDGNIVLVVQSKCFRVHRTILGSYSSVFRDIFALPHDEDSKEDVIDGCPAVQLHDAVDDVQLMLKALYDRSFVFFYNTPMPVSVLGSFIRMGRKYEMRQLLEEAKRRLSLGCVSTLVLASTFSVKTRIALFPRISGNDPLNFTVMNAAREAGVLSVVVVASFFACLVSPPAFIADGYLCSGKRFALSPSNQRCSFLAQHYLADVERQMIRSLTLLPANCLNRFGYANANSCPFAVLPLVRSFQEFRCLFSVWNPSWDAGLCVACRAELRKRHEETRTRLWKGFPVALGLGPWEDLDKASVIADVDDQ